MEWNLLHVGIEAKRGSRELRRAARAAAKAAANNVPAKSWGLHHPRSRSKEVIRDMAAKKKVAKKKVAKKKVAKKKK